MTIQIYLYNKLVELFDIVIFILLTKILSFVLLSSIISNIICVNGPEINFALFFFVLKKLCFKKPFLSSWNLQNFINFCKLHEDKNGFLKQDFFNTKKNKAKFVSGPFTQMIFDIIEDKRTKLKILINNMNITISKSSSNLLYSYI